MTQATGGIETTITVGSTSYKVHTFTSSGTFTVTEAGTVEYLVVAGGGGGGDRHGGGGGAGGLLTSSSFNVTVNSLSIVVGAGGTAGNYESGPTATGGAGSNSQFSSVTAFGGGGGGTYDGNPTGTFGSGGGGGGNGLPGIAGTAGQGNSGGSGNNPAGGGGGGAGGVGGNANNGSGGVGLQSSINGTATFYAGGGGGAWADSPGPATPGGSGGGGAGDWDETSISAGQANTGGGGGATRSGSAGSTGRSGGSGIVIIRYAMPTSTITPDATGGVKTTTSENGINYNIHTFTASGTFSPNAGFDVEYLVVAGGGGGGRYGGGGGAGGLLAGVTAVVSGNYPVIVGSGGSGHLGDAQSGGAGISGGTSSALSLIATGGGGGGNYGNPTGGAGLSGGSGGGGGLSGSSGVPVGGAGTSGQGNPGGNGFASWNGNFQAGGGGGAGSGGATGGNGVGGQGGSGLQSSITGSAVFYAGGGGGSTGGTATPGGVGGGGSGLNTTGSTTADGLANSGGGGGGTRDTTINSVYRAGNGGSGVVIIKYATTPIEDPNEPTEPTVETGYDASGGVTTTTTQNGTVYKVHTFTASGTFTPNGNFNVEYFIVGGGGAGGGGFNSWAGGGGGGAGGVLTNTNGAAYPVTAQAYAIVVGAGGPSVSGNVASNNGSNSTALGLTAIGGGRGGRWQTTSVPSDAGHGGSGGGGPNGQSFSTGGFEAAGQGFPGGDGVLYTGSSNAGCGGGGGATQRGFNATNSVGGAGGAGVTINIAGPAFAYAGGGGGGHGLVGGAGFGGIAGNGGGTNTNGTAGAANTGGGGGGGGSGTVNTSGGTGGSGVVIIRYPTAVPVRQTLSTGFVATGGTLTSFLKDGINYNVHTFTSSGLLEIPGEISANVLVIGGGGSGGNSNTTNGNGGGGAGGVLYGTNISFNSNISVVVGAGGTAVANATVGLGNKGANSSLGIYVAQGGGGGGSTAVGFNSSVQSGGSTGGTATSQAGPGTVTQTNIGLAVGYGNLGGASGTTWTGAGGGGAGTAGLIGSTARPGGDGGRGLSFDITGSSRWYAGGGGGGGNSSERAGDGWHGAGRGFGTTTFYTNSSYPVGINQITQGSSTLNAVANTGGGGGGGSYWAPNGGWTTGSGSGGSGIVVFQYPLSYNEIVLTVSSPAVTLNRFLTNPGIVPISASGGYAVRYSISPALPAGLTFDIVTGTINGLPSPGPALTNETYTITAKSSVTIDDSVSETFSLSTITFSDIIANVTSPSVTIDRFAINPGVIPMTFSGSYGTVIYSISPSLPAGLKFNQATAEITGQPTEPTTGDYSIFQSDFFGNIGSGSFTLTTTTALTNPTLATGGVETTVESNNIFYKVHIFTESGVFNVTQRGPGVIEYLVIGGGGGGGSDMGGGGGGGGYLTGSTYPIEVGNYVVSVGAGGTGGPAGTDQVRANSGGNTKLYPALVTELSITLLGFTQPLVNAANGLVTFNTNGTAYSSYTNLPSYLTGLLATTSYNDGDTTRFSTNKATRVYLMRNSTYGAVDLTGWTEIESGRPYQTGVDMFVYYRDFTAGGPYNIDSSGAFYLFEDRDTAIIAAYGGGGGASDHTAPTSIRAAVAGGSGGGASGNNGNRGNAYPGQGFAGANSIGSWYPGGGGGAGAAGNVNPANGGDGVANNILGTNYFWAGGGGGAGYTGNPGNGGAGGGGGGAPRQATQGFGDTRGFNAGQNATPGSLTAQANVPGGDGGVNTGGGGGGSAHFNLTNPGGNGGSGIVVVRYVSSIPPVEAVSTIYSKTITKFESTNFRPVVPVKGPAPYTYSVTPILPAGLLINSATGYITGTPTEPVTEKQYSVSITDSDNNIASAAFLLTTSLAYLNAIDLVVNRTLFIQTVEAISEDDRTVSDINPALISINVDDSVTGNKNLKYGVVATVLVNQDYQLSTQVNSSDSSIINVDHSFENFISLNNNLKFKYGQLTAEVTQYVQDSQAFLSPGTYTWTVPEGVNEINVVAIGGGGGGTQKLGGGSGGGGGAIAYVNTVAVDPGEVFDIVVGTGGAASTGVGQNGNDTYMSSQGTLNYVLYATGGRGGDQLEWSVTTHIAVFPDSSGTTLDYSVANFGTFTYTLTDAPPGFAINSNSGTVTYTKQFITAQSLNELIVTATAPNGTAITRTDTYLVDPNPVGQQEYTTAGTFSWVAPTGVTRVCAVCVGGGGGGGSSGTDASSGGGGGGLGWKNNITVVPGQSYTVVVGGGGGINASGGQSYFINTITVAGNGGGGGANGSASGGGGGGYVGDGGGNGGTGGNGSTSDSTNSTPEAGAGGGAGGYSGIGGRGAGAQTASFSGGSGDGGGAGGGGSPDSGTAQGGGGVGIFGQGLSGLGGFGTQGGFGGSSGANGSGDGGLYGGGGPGSDSSPSGPGAGGAVRIIWGIGRAFPSTRTANESV